jgi:hypothetical protein
MKIFGLEIRKSRVTDKIETDLPVTDDKKNKTPTPVSVSYHLGVIYAKLDEALKQIDINRREIEATKRATYRRPTVAQDLQQHLLNKNNDDKPRVRTGDPYKE